VEQVGADAADLGQVQEGQSLGFRAAVSRHEGQRKNSRIVLRRTAAVADLNDALYGANTVCLDASNDGVVVLPHQVALADVVGATFGAQDQEPVKAGPFIDLPGVTAP
jgi:hypothetical protein